MLVLSREDPAREPIALETLGNATWIVGLAGTQFAAVLEHACRSAGLTPRNVHRVDDATLVQTLVGAGLGIGRLPALACSSSDNVRFAEAVPPPPRRHVWALVRRGAARRPALAATLHALLHAATLAATTGTDRAHHR